MTAIGLDKAMKERFLGRYVPVSCGWANPMGMSSQSESPFLSGIEERLAGVILLSAHVDGKGFNVLSNHF